MASRYQPARHHLQHTHDAVSFETNLAALDVIIRLAFAFMHTGMMMSMKKNIFYAHYTCDESVGQ
jgi:hypothetical protein